MPNSWFPLIESPVFILCTARSGSTLLRCILNSHNEIYAPHEWNLYHLKIHDLSQNLRHSMELHGWSPDDIYWMLRDRLYYEALRNSKKKILVEKTHSNLAHWEKIAAVWRGAKFILLFRDRDKTVESFMKSFGWSEGYSRRNLLPKFDQLSSALVYLEPARRIVIAYENLIRDPNGEIAKVCSFLGVEYESRMLNYKTDDIRAFTDGVGDWGDKIRSGKIQP